MDLLDGKAAAKHVRVLSYWSLLDLAKRGEVPHIRVGRRIFFRAEALDAWVRGLETGGVKTEEPPALGTLRRIQP